MSSFFNTNAVDAGGPLTREDLERAFDQMKARDDEYRRAPKGPCGCDRCVVSFTTKTRLEREGGGAICGSCGRPFWITPHSSAQSKEEDG